MWCHTFCYYFISCSPILKILSLLETPMNYLQNKYDIFCHLLKTSLYYCVKHDTVHESPDVFHILIFSNTHRFHGELLFLPCCINAGLLSHEQNVRLSVKRVNCEKKERMPKCLYPSFLTRRTVGVGPVGAQMPIFDRYFLIDPHRNT